MLALCHHGLVPAWCRARLKIAAKQQLEHIGPCDLSFISLNQGRLEGGDNSRQRREQNKLLASISYLFRISSLFPTTPSPSYSLLPPLHSPTLKKGRERRAVRQGEKERRQWKAEEGWVQRLLHLLSSSLTWFYHHHKAAIGHFSPQLYRGLQEVEEKNHTGDWQGRGGLKDCARSTKS